MFGDVLATALSMGADHDGIEAGGAGEPRPAPGAARLVLEGVEAAWRAGREGGGREAALAAFTATGVDADR